jgi:hypothetical protein
MNLTYAITNASPTMILYVAINDIFFKYFVFVLKTKIAAVNLA